MSYDIWLKDPVTNEGITIEEPHFMRGGTYALGGTQELWLNITYNYAHYYYEATDGDARFAHEEEYRDGTKTEYGIRGIYKKTGLESIPMLEDMITRIWERYCPNGEWIKTERTERKYIYGDGIEVDVFEAVKRGIEATEVKKIVSEGPSERYWDDTAGNAIKPLYQLIAMAKMRPDGVWDGD